MTAGQFIAAIVVAATMGCGDRGVTKAPETGWATIVTFAFDGFPEDTLRVAVTDEATIAAAKHFIATGTGAKIPIGPIVRGFGADARVPFRFLTADVRLTEVAIELCDGRMMRTTAEVDAFFLGATGNAASPQATWCPWGAYPVNVVRYGPD